MIFLVLQFLHIHEIRCDDGLPYCGIIYFEIAFIWFMFIGQIGEIYKVIKIQNQTKLKKNCIWLVLQFHNYSWACES